MRKRSRVERLVGQWVESIVEDSNCELVDVNFVKEGPEWVLRVFIDKPEGVGVDDCQDVSMQLSERLDQEDPIPQAYSLEVSSPGLERPLTKEQDFQRFAGEMVKVRTYSPLNQRKNFTGKLLGLESGMVQLELDDGVVNIPYEQVAKAKLHVEF